jgi:hypothetical protein
MEEITLEMIEESRWQFQQIVDEYQHFASREKLPNLKNADLDLFFHDPGAFLSAKRKERHINEPAEVVGGQANAAWDMMPIRDRELFIIKDGIYPRVLINEDYAARLIKESNRNKVVK